MGMDAEFRIERVKFGTNGALYDVYFGDNIVITKSRDPECDACRWAQENLPVKADSIIFFREGEPPYMTMRVDWGAKHCTSEEKNRRVGFRKWRPYGKAKNSEEND